MAAGRDSAGQRPAVCPERQPGFLSYGPYTTQVSAGRHRVTWTLGYPDTLPAPSSTPPTRIFTGDSIARIEVFDYDANAILATKEVYRNEFLNPTQFFSLDFDQPTYTTPHRLEFRTYWYGTAHLLLSAVTVSGGFVWTANDPAIGHGAGFIHDGDDWIANSAGPQGYMCYGPYTRSVFPGQRAATFEMILTDTQYLSSQQPICDIDVFINDFPVTLASRRLTAADFIGSIREEGKIRKFTLPFTMGDNLLDYPVEFRVNYLGSGTLRVRKVGIDSPQ